MLAMTSMSVPPPPDKPLRRVPLNMFLRGVIAVMSVGVVVVLGLIMWIVTRTSPTDPGANTTLDSVVSDNGLLQVPDTPAKTTTSTTVATSGSGDLEEPAGGTDVFASPECVATVEKLNSLFKARYLDFDSSVGDDVLGAQIDLVGEHCGEADKRLALTTAKDWAAKAGGDISWEDAEANPN